MKYLTCLLILMMIVTWCQSDAQVTYTDSCHGSPGLLGLPGRDGRDGRDGQAIAGPNGPPGNPGPVGPSGATGTCVCPERNIKQCVWSQLDDGRDAGQIKSCNFTKVSVDTALRVMWNGDLRVYTRADGPSCSRWYITFNGQECDDPLPIDAIIVSTTDDSNQHRPAHIEGICGYNSTGLIHVGLNVAGCNVGDLGNANTGWISTSRMIIEEIVIQL